MMVPWRNVPKSAEAKTYNGKTAQKIFPATMKYPIAVVWGKRWADAPETVSS